jgi:hypothetical protein
MKTKTELQVIRMFLDFVNDPDNTLDPLQCFRLCDIDLREYHNVLLTEGLTF